ncbi:MAG TPA: tetrahydrofolate dehydrogenase/cyclohydrolase catalytic domain-containing protein [Leptospiraceae bacterium]|nr:tetrahydrofolate dehydrogenase/cyclohydrolase catalytic domain-containing protein [Leptospiraceae bacterium]HMW07826.1 tetrahydrofolate dehydrogenase/cyclohydrolase catalytic domain-containing protein [Leptospiraceae bacterium]HMX34618.1 tetrahydrofolate dehydrogenase/cyclohydrolase catalytic domain-containing protein [Leptospiraceae bacterium]HMY33488.1 tetrahydrofolate dehydrogenase/cyclohydrolase catalytic domain-containing protein [Leptospiraceae bacterium]HMZ65644.1 tetrahydrofolate deh
MSSPIVLDGKKLSEKIKANIQLEIQKLKESHNFVPTLATILVGNDPSSKVYVKMKMNACEKLGMKSKLIELPETTTTEELLSVIDSLNADISVTGILLQHPVPSQIDERLAFDRISEKKDVDGVNSLSFGKLSMGEKTFYPCTPYGIILLLEEYGINPTGKHAVIVGRSPILGKPMAMLLLEKNATVTICHSKTKNLPDFVRQADIVVGAVGKPEFIKADWLKEGVVLIDAGYNPGNIGDIDLKNSISKSTYYTPVPGGVGPMTISVLLLQTMLAAKEKFSN